MSFTENVLNIFAHTELSIKYFLKSDRTKYTIKITHTHTYIHTYVFGFTDSGNRILYIKRSIYNFTGQRKRGQVK
uniref:Uncharacterized protein n=1 Tax=Octopus bimaculoides TaxID=37653 RepID=A0A0L8HAP2_OCTBM